MNLFAPFELGHVQLDEGLLTRRQGLNRAYLLSLTVDNLLQNHRLEAGIGRTAILRGNSPAGAGDDRHWGWETPGSPMRGHFVGHWMSAAARMVAVTGDAEIAARLRAVVDGIAECQVENGGEWAFALSEKSLGRLADGKAVWAPQYALHKTLMGLVDVARETANETALQIAVRAAAWFDRWSSRFSRSEFDDILDMETGGMLEVWADLLEMTGSPLFERLIERYDRQRLFGPLAQGDDVLTNMHANTTIPEVLGAGRVFEVTGETRWREVVEAYWRLAVTERGTFVTGGQTAGEVWTPPFAYASRRGDKNQEHCTVYNMIRLADMLFRWTGESTYLDYIERNVFNGILAQQHPRTGMVAYFLPFAGGSAKNWGSPTDDFWCCHGTLVQAHTRHAESIFYRSSDGVTVAQYHPATLTAEVGNSAMTVHVRRPDIAGEVGAHANAGAAGNTFRPESWRVQVEVAFDEPTRAVVRLRMPDWLDGLPDVQVDGTAIEVDAKSGFVEINKTWTRSTIDLVLPKRVRVVPVPDEPSTVAFIDGPVVLAAAASSEFALDAHGGSLDTLLRSDNEREWSQWRPGWRIIDQPTTVRLKPLYEFEDEPFSVYFPTRSCADVESTSSRRGDDGRSVPPA